MIKSHIEKLLCKNNIIVLKGNLYGYIENFVKPIIEPKKLNDFITNPITTNILKKNEK